MNYSASMGAWEKGWKGEREGVGSNQPQEG
jgi:hypothetical protein